MREVGRSPDRATLDDAGTASLTATVLDARVTPPNVLVIGPIAQTESRVSAMVAASGKPARFWAPDVPMPARADGRAIVIRDIATLSAAHQTAWLVWLTAQHRRRPRIIATSPIAVFPLVTQGMFLEDLYYRLNTVLLDLRASTDDD